MFRNYFKVAIRNLLRNKVFSMINILGLSVGLASVIMIILFVRHETSYDSFFKDSDRIYRVISVFKDKNQAHEFPVTLYNVAPQVQNQVPEVSASTRFFRPGPDMVSYNKESYGYYTNMFCDPGFLKVFSYKLIKGNRDECLENPNSVVISQSMAEDIFGESDPLNKILQVNEQDFQIKGILSDIPGNSHLQFDFITSINSVDERTLITDGNSHYTYFRLKDIMTSDIEDKMVSVITGYVNKKFEQYEIEYDFYLQPLSDIHLKSDYSPDFAETGNIQYIYIFSLIAVFILIIAVVNFVNLSIAKADTRKKEVGIRKVNGANKKHLRRQFIGESVMIAILAFLISMLLVETFIADFSGLVNSKLGLVYRNNIAWTILFAILAIVVGLVSGLYPAYYISSFNSIRILKGEQTGQKKRAPLQVILVVLQFTIGVALIASLFGVGKQVGYMKNKELGFNKENVFIVYGLTQKIREKYESIRPELLNNPAVEAVTASMTFPGNGSSGMNLKLREQDPKEAFPVRENRVQPDYIKTYGIEILKGRDFSDDLEIDKEGFLINETAAKMLGVENVIGQEVDLWTHRGKVIGVFKDFHIKSLHHKIEPYVLSRYNRQIYNISVRFAHENAEQARDHVLNVLNDYDPDYTSQYLFLDNFWKNKYSREDKSAKLIIAGTILTIIISIMGLFALTAFNINKRIKEIGIRKSLGASVQTIVKMLLRQYLKWVLVASVIATPFAIWFMENWLSNFAYRISVQWWFFAVAVVIAMFISTLTILMKAIKAANTNPIETLRYE